jgi:hypothetical protein
VTTHPIIIGLGHTARVGKDTAAEALAELGYERLAFADIIRECLLALNPITGNGARVATMVWKYGWDEAKTRSYEIRELLQRLGTEVGRDILGQNIWVNATFAKMQPRHKYVITDVRFPNEANAILAAGGLLYKIERPGIKSPNNHPSETALADFKTWSHVLVNNYHSAEAFKAAVVHFFRAGVDPTLGSEVWRGEG